MKGKYSTGIWFIFFGIIALLHNFDYINFNFWVLLTYWPLIIIAIGANLIFQNKTNGAIILSILNIGLCLFICYKGITTEKNATVKIFSSTNNTNIDTTGTLPLVQADFKESTEKASLEMNLGAVSLTLDSITSNHLIEASTKNQNIGLKLLSKGDDRHAKIELSNILKSNNNKTTKNAITFALNRKPIWDLELNIGAANFRADFSPYKIDKIELNAGAAAINIKLGEPLTNNSKVEINTAASSCVIAIPKDVACRIEMETLMSSNKLPGFIKKEGGYETENYSTSDLKFNIDLTGAANSLKINRY